MVLQFADMWFSTKNLNLYLYYCVITGILEETLVISWYYM